LQSLLQQKAVICNDDNTTQASLSETMTERHKVVDLETVKSTTNELCYAIETITRNEYQFLNYCKQHFNYSPSEEIVLSNPDEKLQCGYIVPID
jgi:hypothetical protein